MTRLSRKKGIVLLQTLILSVILSMIAMMMLKWVLGRYMSAARTTRSTTARGHSQGYVNFVTSNWNKDFTTGGTSSIVLDNGLPTQQTLAQCRASNNRVVVTIDEDNPAAAPPCP